MKVRAMEEKDIPILKELYDKAESCGNGHGGPWATLTGDKYVERYVVVDENDVPLAGAAAKLMPSICLIVDNYAHPQVKMQMIAMLNDRLTQELMMAKPRTTQTGFIEAVAFLPRRIARMYGRRLQRAFGWEPTEPKFSTYTIWKG